jgi:DNA-binding MarR family transcriptional regulator
LIAGDNEQALQRASRTVEAFGLRVGARLSIEDAPERIRLQAAATALWVELDRDGGVQMDRLLDRVSEEAAEGRCAAIVAGRSEFIDPLLSQLGDSNVELVIDGTDADRAAALAVALSGVHRGHQLSDVASDRNSARLRQLSDEVSRIASTLARLSTGPDAPQRQPSQPVATHVPQVSADTVRAVIRARRLRSRYFADELFADPAWDMLLDLLQAEIAQLRVPVSSLCIAAAVPATTALRWLKSMTEQGLFVRRADPHDGRRVFVELSTEASVAMRRYFAEVGEVAVV